MGSMAEACAECSRTCLSLHRTKHNPYPIVSSFFKVMFGNHFSDLLIMPPKFARTIMAMDTYLEDATGQKWEVNLSNVKGGTLAFTKGWHEFSMDHGIELGDFLVFHYFKGSHFVVQIFGRSGCEKPMIFSGKNYLNKRAKLNTDSVPAARSPIDDSSCKVSPAKVWPNVCMNPRFSVDVSIPMDDVKMEEKAEIRVNVPRQGNTDKWPRDGVLTDVLVEVEPCLVTSKITSYYSSEDDRRDCLLDLSVFEMPEKQVVDAAITTSLHETQTSVASLDVMKCHMSNDIVEISDEEDSIELSSDTVSGVYVPLDISSPLKAITLQDNSDFSAAPPASCELPRGEMRVVKSEPKPSKSDADLVQDSANLSTYNGHKVMRHSTWTTSIIEDKGPRSMIMSQKAINLCDSSSARTAPGTIKFTCLIKQNNESFLELPGPLPVMVCRKQDTVTLEQNLVLLRDPVGRLWPVMYHQRNGCRALTSGWEKFMKSNGIRPGDKCTFVVENINESIHQVQIVSRLSPHQIPVS